MRQQDGKEDGRSRFSVPESLIQYGERRVTAPCRFLLFSDSALVLQEAGCALQRKNGMNAIIHPIFPLKAGGFHRPFFKKTGSKGSAGTIPFMDYGW